MLIEELRCDLSVTKETILAICLNARTLRRIEMKLPSGALHVASLNDHMCLCAGVPFRHQRGSSKYVSTMSSPITAPRRIRRLSLSIYASRFCVENVE